MGFVTRHREWFLTESTRFRKVAYLGLTSGLCGSITTFATWNVQCNRACFLDSALDPDSFVAARILTWLVCLATCVALALKSLHIGHHLATFSSYSDANRQRPSPDAPEPAHRRTEEAALLAAYAAATALGVVLPALRGSPQLAFAASFGACGAFLRYLLSLLNPRVKTLPVGTLLANTVATWLLAGLTASAELGPTAPALASAALYGLGVGFCGCLSTVSTLANELDSLPPAAAYAYGLASFAVAQAGVACLLDTPDLVLSAHSVADANTAGSLTNGTQP